MRQSEIDQLEKAPYNTPLRPGVPRDLGADVQLWAVRVDGHHARKTDKFLALDGVTLCNGSQTITIPSDAFPLPAKRGVFLHEFGRVLWAHLPHKNQKTRVVLLAYGTPENYGPLDVHDLDPRITYTPSGSDSYALKFRDPEQHVNLEFIDLQSYFPGQTLAEVSEYFGVEARTPAAQTWAIYAALSDRLGTEYGIDPAVYRTPAACAARVYISQYLESSPGGTNGVLKSVRLQAMRSYWGGRAEAFARGHHEGEFHVYDAVSMYPSAAIALGQMPTAGSWYRLTAYLLSTCRAGICTVEFDFRKVDENGELLEEQELHPCLPVSGPSGMVYPLCGISHCTVHEVRYALELGATVRLISGFGYTVGDETLAEYSADLLARKQEADTRGDVVSRTLYKLLLNSLYGKFGQHRVGYSLDTMRKAARLLNLPDLSVLAKIPNWPAMAADIDAGGEGKSWEPEIMVGGQWCPEWAALILGYARMVESRAMRDYVALVGTTDSVIIPGDAGPEFQIAGVTYKKEASGNRLTIVRARLYCLTDGGEVTKIALHGAPQIAQMAAELINWDGAEEIPVQALRVRKLRDGLMIAQPPGISKTVTHTVSMSWDNKRELIGDYSTPLTFTDEETVPASESVQS